MEDRQFTPCDSFQKNKTTVQADTGTSTLPQLSFVLDFSLKDDDFWRILMVIEGITTKTKLYPTYLGRSYGEAKYDTSGCPHLDSINSLYMPSYSSLRIFIDVPDSKIPSQTLKLFIYVYWIVEHLAWRNEDARPKMVDIVVNRKTPSGNCWGSSTELHRSLPPPFNEHEKFGQKSNLELVLMGFRRLRVLPGGRVRVLLPQILGQSNDISNLCRAIQREATSPWATEVSTLQEHNLWNFWLDLCLDSMLGDDADKLRLARIAHTEPTYFVDMKQRILDLPLTSQAEAARISATLFTRLKAYHVAVLAINPLFGNRPRKIEDYKWQLRFIQRGLGVPSMHHPSFLWMVEHHFRAASKLEEWEEIKDYLRSIQQYKPIAS